MDLPPLLRDIFFHLSCILGYWYVENINKNWHIGWGDVLQYVLQWREKIYIYQLNHRNATIVDGYICLVYILPFYSYQLSYCHPYIFQTWYRTVLNLYILVGFTFYILLITLRSIMLIRILICWTYRIIDK